MKWHLNILLLIINLSIIGIIILGIIISIDIASSIITPETSFSEKIKLDYFQDAKDTSSEIVAYVFIAIYLALHLFLLTKFALSNISIKALLKRGLIYKNQNKDLRNIGSGFILFAKLKYSLLMISGVFFYNDITVFIDALPQFLLFYVLGKILLMISLISAEGELIKKENELTV